MGDAQLCKPLGSVRQLLQEARWEHADRLQRSGSVPHWRDVGGLYWGSTVHAPRSTSVAQGELALYRCLIAIPLAITLPLLTLREKRKHRRACQQRELELLAR